MARRIFFKERDVEKPGEAAARIKSVLDTVADKREELAKITSDQLRLQIMREKAEKALDNARVQLLAELKKFDPDLELVTAPELEDARG